MSGPIAPLTTTISSGLSKEIVTALIAFGAAVVAASIASFTTWISNKNARRMLQSQLDTVERQANEKRILDLRRDVYLPSIRAVSETMAVIAEMLDPKSDDSAIWQRYAETNSSINGVHLVGSDTTLQAVIELSIYFGNLFVDLALLRAELVAQTQLLEALRVIESAEIKNGDMLVEMMKNHNLTASDELQWVRIWNQWEVHQRTLQDLRENRMNQGRVVVHVLANLLEEFTGKLHPLLSLQVNALAAIRLEMGFPFDRNAYLKMQYEAKETMLNAARRAAEHIRSMAQEQKGKQI